MRAASILSCGGTQQNAEAYTSVREIKLLLPQVCSTYAALVSHLSRITVIMMVTVTVIRSGCNRVTAAVRCCSASQTASDACCRPSDAVPRHRRHPTRAAGRQMLFRDSSRSAAPAPAAPAAPGLPPAPRHPAPAPPPPAARGGVGRCADDWRRRRR